MILYSDIEKLKKKYELYSNYMLERIRLVRGEESIGTEIKLKVSHGISMCASVRATTINSGFFNETYGDSGAVDGLLHDIGRFEQYLLSGTLKDEESRGYTKYGDHGQFGKYLLSRNNSELLRYFLPKKTKYDHILKEVVGEHTTICNPSYLIPIQELTSIFAGYELSEILNSSNEDIKNKLIALKLLVLREEDSLEILQKVRDELWRPAIGSEEKYHIKDEIWKQFINLEYLNMGELKQRGLWTCNAGFLLRYSLLYNNINFVGTLKTLLEDGTIDKVYQNQINNVTNDRNEFVTDSTHIDSRLYDAYEYIKKVVEALISTSSDGKIITKESREEAKQKVFKSM